MSLRVLPEAEEELRATTARYNIEKQGLGNDFAEAVGLAFEEIANHPRRYPKPERIRPDREFRCFLLHRFPYVIHYLVTDDDVVVFAVAHTSRKPGYWRDRKG